MTDLNVPLSSSLKALRDGWRKDADALQQDGHWGWGQSMRLCAADLDPLILRCEAMEAERSDWERRCFAAKRKRQQSSGDGA
jgi:hypothetical protein